jgi:hypothetical protein
MEEIDFYDFTDLSEKKVGDRIGKLKLAEISSIKDDGYGRVYDIKYKGKDTLFASYEYSLKEKIKDLDYLEFIRIKDIRMEKIMRLELYKFLFQNRSVDVRVINCPIH